MQATQRPSRIFDSNLTTFHHRCHPLPVRLRTVQGFAYLMIVLRQVCSPRFFVTRVIFDVMTDAFNYRLNFG